MLTSIHPEAPPLRIDPDGAWRVGDSRVLLELVIFAHQQGESPEEIVERYPTAALADVYAVIAYYLKHRDEVDQYLAAVDKESAELREWFQSRQPDRADVRERMNVRREQ